MKTDYDDRGRIIARQDSRFSKWKFTEYDDRDNLISVTDPLRHVLTLAYDLDDRLILKTKFIYDDPLNWFRWISPRSDNIWSRWATICLGISFVMT